MMYSKYTLSGVMRMVSTLTVACLDQPNPRRREDSRLTLPGRIVIQASPYAMITLADSHTVQVNY